MPLPDLQGATAARARIDAQLSARIRAARVICILALVFVHVPPWAPQLGNPPRELGAFDYVYVFLCEALSRTSVPLLSVISGYLLVTADRGGGHAALLFRKGRSLLLPLLLWNLISAAGRAASGTLGAADPLGWLDRLFAVSSTPLVLPLYFLRDIFLCVLVAPVLLWLLERRAGLTLALLAALALTGLLDPALINPLIIVFFAAGCAMGLGTFPVRTMPPPGVIVASFIGVAMLATAIVLADLRAPQPGAGRWGTAMLLAAQRTMGALFFWHIAGMLARSRWSGWIDATEPFIFFHFCAHTLILGGLWAVLSHIGVRYGGGP